MVKISIGLPIYNAEKVLHRVLDSILNQTHVDFELIISDNASTDNTSSICNEYTKKDNRIKYFRQQKNKGIHYNFNFVLQNAKYDYFAWIGADDYWEKENLKENLNILVKNQNIVCSMGIPDFVDDSEINGIPSKILPKLRSKYLNEKYETISGNYDQKVKKYLKNSMCDMFYGIYRTNSIKKCFLIDKFAGSDWAINLNVLKLGDVHVIDKKLWHKTLGGISSKGMIKTLSILNKGKISKIIPYYNFTSWCVKNLGVRICLKNFNYFILLNIAGMVSLSLNLINKNNK